MSRGRVRRRGLASVQGVRPRESTNSDLPPVASGGRYDALTAQLGAGRAIPAVGGIIRPGLIAELEASC